MSSALDFYFEFASPYGYIASLRIDAIAAAHEREVAWCPIMLGAVMKVTGSGPNMHLPLKGPYLLTTRRASRACSGFPSRFRP